MKSRLFRIAAPIVLSLITGLVAAQPRAPTKQEIVQLQRLASQSVLHVETSLKKIEQAGPMADEGQLQIQVIAPATALMKEWKAFKLADSVMFPYMACQEILTDVQVYGKDALTPPKYHLSMPAVQKLRFIKESLADCRKLRTALPG